MYRAEVTAVDRAVGLFLDGIDADDAVVVVTSDHGESMGEHNLQFKHGPQVFPSDVHVPLAVRAPGVAPAVTDAMVRTIDIAGTVLDRLGVDAELPPEADELLRWSGGGAGLPAFGVATQPWSEALEVHDAFPLEPLQRIVRTPEAAYMETPFRDLRAFFDRVRDPGEVVPVVPGDPALADSLRDALDAWIDAGRVIPGYAPVHDEGLREQLRSLGYLE
jgi:arylsulfatase A-like enzyme